MRELPELILHKIVSENRQSRGHIFSVPSPAFHMPSLSYDRDRFGCLDWAAAIKAVAGVRFSDHPLACQP